jgi:hypothetical protein
MGRAGQACAMAVACTIGKAAMAATQSQNRRCMRGLLMDSYQVIIQILTGIDHRENSQGLLLKLLKPTDLGILGH